MDNSGLDNISVIFKLLEKTLYDKLNDKDKIIQNLTNENKLLREQLNKKNKSKNKKIKNSNNNINANQFDFQHDPLIDEISDNVIYIDTKPSNKIQLKQANDFFKKEYNKYKQKQ